MYLKFYQLAKEPFHVTPDPEFLFLSESHKQALAAVIYGVKERKGFVTITGPVGSGKTTVLRSFLKQSDPARFRVVYVFDPAVPFSTLVANLCREFGLDPTPDDVPHMTEMLYLALADHYSKGWTVALIIDEAQNMPVKTLESLRMLSNFETTQDKLLQIVLAGQPELEDLLNTPSLDPLRQRRAIRAVISPLTKEESISYIKYRLTKAGAAYDGIFGRKALNSFVKQARGIPRTINILCDNALACGYGYGKTRIDSAIAREVIRDMKGGRRRSFGKFGVMAGAAAAAVLCVSGTLMFDPSLLEIFSRQHRPPVFSAGFVGTPQDFIPQINSASPGPSAAQGAAGGTDKPASGVVRVVKRGDTMFDLVRVVYGPGESKRPGSLIEMVQRNNPRIKNPSYILEGQQIFFPDVKGEPMEARR
jgi:general secretion pathway protein A